MRLMWTSAKNGIAVEYDGPACCQCHDFSQRHCYRAWLIANATATELDTDAVSLSEFDRTKLQTVCW